MEKQTIEMWGYFIGMEYAHRRYGPLNHSQILRYFNTQSADTTRFINSWYAANENRGDMPDERFESDHIPACFLHDLMDDNGYNQNQVPILEESSGVVDRISGYSIGTIFNNMGSSTTSAADLINRLRNHIPPANTIADYDSLKLSYGY